ncbi:MAG: hypothetical protein K2K43_01775, partial [Alistipes sp.]|nr:hypothetical protein [Alistipes sp.]
DWVGKVNNNLWGNPQGSDYPRMSTLQQSIFDPCPAGYRVAPKDLWIAFTATPTKSSVGATEEAWAENIINALNIDKTTHKLTVPTQRGLFFCYGVDSDGIRMWQQEPTDFYPASGYRSSAGTLSGVGTGSWCWSSSPAGIRGGYLRYDNSSVSPLHSDGRAYGFVTRCVREH